MNSLIPDAMAQAAGGAPAGAGAMPFVMMAVFVVIFYFLLIAPMRKRQKALAQMVDSRKKGDRIITSGGIYGEIAGVDGETVILKVADNVRIKLAKSAIAGLEKEGETSK
jgi:preprotein translocase subunit YajC